MISSVEEALEQNSKLVEECFKLTQKYERSESELTKCRQRTKELKIIAAMNGNSIKNDSAILSTQKLIAMVQELKVKDKEIEDYKQEAIDLNAKLSRNHDLFRPMIQKYVEASKVITEQSTQIKTLQDKTSRMKIALNEGENREKKLESKLAKLQQKESVEEINKQKRNEEEIVQLKLAVEDRDEKIIACVHMRNRGYAHLHQIIQKKEEKLVFAESLIETLKSKVNNWYQAYGALRSEMIELRKDKLTPSSELHNVQLERVVENLFKENAKIESSLEEAKQHICQLQREAKDTGSLKSVFQHSRSDVKGSSDEDKGVIDRIAKMEVEMESMKENLAYNSFVDESSSLTMKSF